MSIRKASKCQSIVLKNSSLFWCCLWLGSTNHFSLFSLHSRDRRSQKRKSFNNTFPFPLRVWTGEWSLITNWHWKRGSKVLHACNSGEAKRVGERNRHIFHSAYCVTVEFPDPRHFRDEARQIWRKFLERMTSILYMDIRWEFANVGLVYGCGASLCVVIRLFC